MPSLLLQQQAHPLEFIGLQVKLTISCGIEILVYNWLLLILPADIHGGLVNPLWFWALRMAPMIILQVVTTTVIWNFPYGYWNQWTACKQYSLYEARHLYNFCPTSLEPSPLYWPVISSPFIYEPPFSPAIWSVFGKANAWEWSKQAVQTNLHESVKFSFTYLHVSAMKNKPMALRSQDILLDGSSCKRTLPEKFSMPHTKFMFACFASFFVRTSLLQASGYELFPNTVCM